MKASRETERIVKEEIRKLPADGSFEEIPEDHHGFALQLSLPPIRAWKSRWFVAQLYAEGAARRLSVQRSGANAYIRPQNRDTRPISWDELMAVKHALGFGETWAAELFPADSAVINACPMRHLWLLEEPPSYGWHPALSSPSLGEGGSHGDTVEDEQ